MVAQPLFFDSSLKQAAKQRVRQLESNIASYPKGYALWQYIDLLMQQTEIEIVITGQNAFRSASNFQNITPLIY